MDLRSEKSCRHLIQQEAPGHTCSACCSNLRAIVAPPDICYEQPGKALWYLIVVWLDVSLAVLVFTVWFILSCFIYSGKLH